DRFELRREQQLAALFAVVERLDADAVPSEEQLLFPPVPDRKSEHPAQVIDAALTEILVEVDDRLGVAVGSEHMAAPFERAAQLAVVVDLAVEHDPDRAVFVRDGLLSVAEVDDAQPPHADR